MKHPGRVSWLLAALLLFSPQLTVLASENAAMESLAESPVVSPAETAPGSEVSAEENAAAAAESEGTEGMQSSAEVSSAGSYEAGDAAETSAADTAPAASDETLVTERAAADSAATCEIPAEENAAATDSATACEIPAADVSADETQTEAKAGFSEEEAEPAVIKTRTVYLDAALSGICYQDSPAGSGSGIPGEDGIVRYAVFGGQNQCLAQGEMSRLPEHSEDGRTWKAVYSAEVPEEAETICFCSSAEDPAAGMPDGTITGYGSSTGYLPIPEMENPCFYADAGDPVVYTSGARRGYWDSVYSVRSPEKENDEKGEPQDILDVPQGQMPGTAGMTYVPATVYDYYSDIEMNGENRFGKSVNGVNYRSFMPFRILDETMSDYYRSHNAPAPIYTGAFSGSERKEDAGFEYLRKEMNLYGSEDYAKFYWANVAIKNIHGEDAASSYNSAAWNLAGHELQGYDGTGSGNLLCYGTDAPMPYFSEAFLEGGNSRNTQVGKVFKNTAFPFFRSERDGDGIAYWTYDSMATSLHLYETGTPDERYKYYLADTGRQPWSKNVGCPGDQPAVANPYGFFPLNDRRASMSGADYDYGFGVRMDIDFKLTQDGNLVDTTGTPRPITFNFSGDDDVWVFIDGKLALDLGGAHGKSYGCINFSSDLPYQSSYNEYTSSPETAQVPAGTVFNSAVKKSLGFENLTEGPQTVPLDPSLRSPGMHTMTLFYMERGLWESNMKVEFNFLLDDTLHVRKKVNVDSVNPLFKELLGSQTYRLEAAGQSFELGDGEEKSFRDVFKRGSTVHLEEQASALYKTNVTVLENGTDVTELVKKSGGDLRDLVFRSYLNPDDINAGIDLTALFTNTVNTGSLIVDKRSSDGSSLAGIYHFKVCFTLPAGQTAETEFDIAPSSGIHTHAIRGVPIGTRYEIEEVSASDKTKLMKIEGPSLQPELFHSEDGKASGTIAPKAASGQDGAADDVLEQIGAVSNASRQANPADDASGPEYTVTFYNGLPPAFDLPKTGGSGILLFLLCGGTLAAAGFAFIRERQALH